MRRAGTGRADRQAGTALAFEVARVAGKAFPAVGGFGAGEADAVLVADRRWGGSCRRPRPCVVPIPGASTSTHLMDNAGAADVKLSEADRADLDALPTPEGGRY